MTINLFDNISTINNIMDSIKKDKSTLQEPSFEKSLDLSIMNKSEKEDKSSKEKNKINGNDYFNEPELNFIQNLSYKKNQNLIRIKLPNIKLRKEDLDNIPLPVFSCIYCANERISFNHLSNEILSNKYLFLTSIYDLKKLNFLISFKISAKKNYNDKLLNIYLENSEYIYKFHSYGNIKKYFKDNKFKIECLKSKSDINDIFKHHFDLFFKEKMKKENKNKSSILYKKYKNMVELSGNYRNHENYTDREELKCPNKLIYKNKHQRIHVSNSSLLNTYYKCFNRRFYNLNKSKSNKMIMNQTKIIIESKDEKKDFIDFLEEDNLKRKINKNDIEWENDCYDVYNPKIDDDFLDFGSLKKENKLMKLNKNLIKMYLGSIKQYNDNTFNYLNHLEKGSVSAKNRIYINLKSNSKNISDSFFNSNKKKNLINRIKNPLLHLNKSNFLNSKSNLNIRNTENKIIPRICFNNHNKNDNSIIKKKKKLKDLYSKTEKEFEIVRNKAINFKRVICSYSLKDKEQSMKNNLYNQNNKINIKAKNINNISNNIYYINTEGNPALAARGALKKFNFLMNKKIFSYYNTNLFNKNIASDRIKDSQLKYNNINFLEKSKNYEISKKMYD